jgi:hypothetical protein
LTVETCAVDEIVDCTEVDVDATAVDVEAFTVVLDARTATVVVD